MEELILLELKKLRLLYPEIKTKFKVCFELKNIYGAYQPKTKILYFNLDVAKVVGFNKFKEVVVHEFAHFISDIKYKNLHHSELWKNEMLFCGILNARARINFDNIFIPINKTPVKCNCKTYYITKNRLTRMKKGRVYKCPSCKGPIKEI